MTIVALWCMLSPALGGESTDDVYAADATELLALGEMRIADLGIEPVLLDDGESYYYELPPGLETPDFVQDGPLYYVYDGQQTYGRRDLPTAVTWTVPEYRLTDISHDPDAYLGVGQTVKVDMYGRRWLLSGFDAEALAAKIDAYDALVASTFGLEDEAAEGSGIEWYSNAGTVEESALDVDIWVLFYCDSDSGAEVYDHVSGGVTSGLDPYGPPDVRQKKIVFIQGVINGTAIAYRGSGVLVDDDTVLTAAHVINDGVDYTDIVNLRVCTFGNVETGAQCRGVASLTVPNGAFNDTIEGDYGVMELTAPFSPTVGWMALSTASDATLAAATHFHEGYSSWRPTCVANSTSNDAQLTVDGYYWGINYGTMQATQFHYRGSWLLSAYGPAKQVLAGYIKFNVSSASAMSGSPYYYCPSGCTATSGTHFITAVTSGHAIASTTNGETNGPKARVIRTWVLANM